jgi:hypothetical protein
VPIPRKINGRVLKNKTRPTLPNAVFVVFAIFVPFVF